MNATSSSNPLDSSAMLKLTSPVIAERRVLVVIVKLQNDLSHNFTPKELGKEVGLSDSQLQALFKKIVGIPLGQFRRQMRLTAAHNLFVTEFLLVKEVMDRVGFHNAKAFRHDFKKAYGTTPGEFRKQCLSGKCPTAL